MKKNKLLAVVAGVTTLAVSLTACGKNGGDDASDGPSTNLTEKKIELLKAEKPDKNPDAAKQRKDTLIVGTDGLDGIFNPLYSDSAYDMMVCSTMYSGLMDVKDDGTLENGMIEGYKVSEDQKTYTMTLKKDLKWSDGKPLTTDDILFTYLVQADKTYTGPSDLATLKLVGYKDYQEGKANTISGIKVIDERTIAFTLEEVSAKALYSLSSAPIPKHHYGVNYKQGEAEKLEELNRTPGPSSGAYIFKSYKEGEQVTLEANPNYYRGQAKIKNLVFKVVNQNTEMQLMETGEIDMFNSTIKPETMEQFKDMGFVNVHYWPNNGYGYMGMNHKDPKFKDQKVRQALAIGLDRKKIVSTVYGEYAETLNIPQSRLSWAYTDEGLDKYEFDTDRASKLLDEAGWKKGADGIREKDGVKMEIKFWATSPNEVNDALIPVAKECYEKLGIKFLPENMDFPTMRKKIRDYKQGKSDIPFDMYFMAFGLVPDPDGSSTYKTDGSQNDTFYSNKKVDELLEKGLKELDTEKRKAIYKDYYKEINKDVPFIYMYQRRDGWAVNARVKNFKMTPYRDFTYDIHTFELGQ